MKNKKNETILPTILSDVQKGNQYKLIPGVMTSQTHVL